MGDIKMFEKIDDGENYFCSHCNHNVGSEKFSVWGHCPQKNDEYLQVKFRICPTCIKEVFAE